MSMSDSCGVKLAFLASTLLSYSKREKHFLAGNVCSKNSTQYFGLNQPILLYYCVPFILIPQTSRELKTAVISGPHLLPKQN